MENEGDTVIVMLITSNAEGCAPDTTTMTFSTWINPQASFTTSNNCAEIFSNFNNTSIPRE